MKVRESGFYFHFRGASCIIAHVSQAAKHEVVKGIIGVKVIKVINLAVF